MLLDLSDVFSTLAGLFLIIGVGFFAIKRNLLPTTATNIFSDLLMKITLPCTVFTSMIREFDPNFLRDGAIVLGLGCIFSLGGVVIGSILSHFGKLRWGTRGAWIFCCAYCNGGFMGFPIALAFFGEEGLALAAILNIDFTVLTYTLGVKLLSMDSSDPTKANLSLKKVLFTVVNLSTALGLACYFMQVEVPTALMAPMTQIGNITTPISMLIVGMTLASIKLDAIFTDPLVLTASAVRLLLIPALVCCIVFALPIANPLIPCLLLTIFAMPSPGSASAMAYTYGSDQNLTAKITFVTSLLSLITIPLWTLMM